VEIQHNPLAEVPRWIIDTCKTARPKSEAAGKRLVEEDDEAIKRASDWLAKHAPDASEGHRDDEAFKVAARLYDYGVSRDTAQDLLAEWAFNHTFPPMDPSDIARVAESAGRNRGNAIGTLHPGASGFEAVEISPRSDSAGAESAHGLTIPAHVAAARALSNPARPLIKGLVDRGTLSIMYGRPGSGKSFLGMDLGYHVGKGGAWAGMKVHGGSVIYVAAEGGEGVYRRMAALAKHYGDLTDSALHILPHSLDLLHSPKDAERLLVEMSSIGNVELVIIDTVARVLSGGDENSGQDMGGLIRNMDRVRVQGDCHVMGIHHTGKDVARGARGHSSLLGAVDTEIEVSKGLLTLTKARDMSDRLAIGFTLKPVRIGQDTDGDDITSCYVEIRQKGDFDVPLSAGAQQVLDALLDAIEDGKHPADKPFSVSVVADCVVNSGASLSVEPHSLRHHMKELEDRKEARKVKRGQWLVERKLKEEKGNTEQETERKPAPTL
jgi:hypothetical protein